MSTRYLDLALSTSELETSDDPSDYQVGLGGKAIALDKVDEKLLPGIVKAFLSNSKGVAKAISALSKVKPPKQVSDSRRSVMTILDYLESVEELREVLGMSLEELRETKLG